MIRHSTPSSKLLRHSAVVLIAAIAEFAPGLASATVVTSAANIPYSGISPGGVDMATGELIVLTVPASRGRSLELMASDDYSDPFAQHGGSPWTGVGGANKATWTPVARYYASMLAREGLSTGHLGTNWLGTYDWSLSVATPMVTIVTNRGQRIQFQQSPVGAWDLVSPTYEKYRLDFVGSMWRLTHPGLRRVFLFDGTTLLLTQILDEHGNSLTLSYSAGLLSRVSDGLGRMLSFTYDASGNVIMVGDGTRSVSYAYTGGLLTGVTDAEGHTWTYVYQTTGPVQGLLIGVTEPLGNSPLTQSYDLSGRVISQTDALGSMAMYSYDTPSGNVYTDPLGNAWTYLHDSQNRLSTLTDPARGMTSFTYDPPGRLASAARPLGDATSFTYDPSSGYPSSITLGDGSVFSYGYSSHSVSGATFFDLATANYPGATSETYGRDAAGNLTDFTDRGGFHWLGTYNARGQLLTGTNPSGGLTTFTYDPLGRPATGRDNAGNTTSYMYDALSRLTQITWPDGPTRSFEYDNLDHVTGLTDERGKLWSYAYDDNGRLMTVTDPLLDRVQLVWDLDDRLSQVIDPLSHATVYAYDPAGRLASRTDRTGNMTSYQYDALGRLIHVIDPAGGTSTFSYDANGRVPAVQDALGHSSSFMYDARDRVTHVTDPVGTGFDYTYDPLGRLLSASAPLGHTKTFTYDPRGLLTSYFNVTSEVDFARTPLGEIAQVTDPNRNDWPRLYDPQGRMTSAADPLARTTSYTYDTRSRLTHAALPMGSVDLTYDPASRLGGRMFSDGTSFTYSYDDANRLTGATGASFAYDAAGRMTSSNGLTMGYDNEGRITSETLAPGKVVSCSYNNRGLLTGVTDWVGGTMSFTYDAAGRLTGIARPDGTTATYQYDDANRLISAVESQPGPSGTRSASIALTRDALGRATGIDRRQPLMPGATSPATTAFTYDAASQINGLSWDPLGRLVSDGSRVFEWDGASRLKHYAAGADSPRFTYDAFGRMLSRTQGASGEQYVWNYAHGHPTLDAVYQGTTPKKFYVYTPSGILLYSVDAATGARRFYHYDEDGNTIFLTNDLGSVTTEYAYTPFGGISSLGATADNPFTWGAAAGMIQLGSSGLYSRYGSTVFDAQTMRVISGSATQSGPAGAVGDPNISPGPWLTKNPGPVQSPGSVIWEVHRLFNTLGLLEPGQPLDLGSGSFQLTQNLRPISATLYMATFTEPNEIGIPTIIPGSCSPGSWLTKNPGPIQSSGIAEFYGNDMIVSLAQTELSVDGRGNYWGRSAADCDGFVYPPRIRKHLVFAGTSFHEIGHNLALCHGAPALLGKPYGDLSLPRHVFRVFATDQAGNRDPSPPQYPFTYQRYCPSCPR